MSVQNTRPIPGDVFDEIKYLVTSAQLTACLNVPGPDEPADTRSFVMPVYRISDVKSEAANTFRLILGGPSSVIIESRSGHVTLGMPQRSQGSIRRTGVMCGTRTPSPQGVVRLIQWARQVDDDDMTRPLSVGREFIEEKECDTLPSAMPRAVRQFQHQHADADTDQVMTLEEASADLDRISCPVGRPSEPLPFDPDTYPISF